MRNLTFFQIKDSLFGCRGFHQKVFFPFFPRFLSTISDFPHFSNTGFPRFFFTNLDFPHFFQILVSRAVSPPSSLAGCWWRGVLGETEQPGLVQMRRVPGELLHLGGQVLGESILRCLLELEQYLVKMARRT
jgi:hypothetical protein